MAAWEIKVVHPSLQVLPIREAATVAAARALAIQALPVEAAIAAAALLEAEDQEITAASKKRLQQQGKPSIWKAFLITDG